MNEAWNKIFKKYIKDFHAIDLLQADRIIDEEETLKLKNKLLVDIIVTMESEVKENE
jgi:hypothetical protein